VGRKAKRRQKETTPLENVPGERNREGREWCTLEGKSRKNPGNPS